MPKPKQKPKSQPEPQAPKSRNDVSTIARLTASIEQAARSAKFLVAGCLVYEKGGFFLPHRDSEKHDGMVASLIVVLPNPFEGGELIVRHGADRETLTFAEAAAGTTPCFAALYADCEHEVERVTRGTRIALAYNLVLAPKRRSPARDETPAAPANPLAESIDRAVKQYETDLKLLSALPTVDVSNPRLLQTTPRNDR